MDCLEFRRQLGAEPHLDSPELRAHRDRCPACAAAWTRAQQFERELAAALAVPVPEGLAERVLLAQATMERGRRRRRHTAWLAIAATVLLTVLGGGGLWMHADAHSLPAMAVAHARAAEEAFSLHLTRPLTRQAVAAGFAGRGLALRGPVPAHTTYVHDCIVGPYRVVHLVTRADGEAVVVLYVPHHAIDSDREFHRGDWRGREVAMTGGTLVLLTRGGDRAPLVPLARAWQHAIEGSRDSTRAPLAP